MVHLHCKFNICITRQEASADHTKKGYSAARTAKYNQKSSKISRTARGLACGGHRTSGQLK